MEFGHWLALQKKPDTTLSASDLWHPILVHLIWKYGRVMSLTNVESTLESALSDPKLTEAKTAEVSNLLKVLSMLLLRGRKTRKSSSASEKNNRDCAQEARS